MACSHATLWRPYSLVGETGVSTRSGGSRSWTSPKMPWDDAKTSRLAVGEASICSIRLRVASTLTRRPRSGAFSGSSMAARCTTASTPSSAAPSDPGSVTSPQTTRTRSSSCEATLRVLGDSRSKATTSWPSSSSAPTVYVADVAQCARQQHLHGRTSESRREEMEEIFVSSEDGPVISSKEPFPRSRCRSGSRR